MNAKELIGEQNENDWILKPEVHADQFSVKAGPLVRILKSEAIKPIIISYNNADKKAEEYQKSYKKWGSIEVYLTAFAAIVGSILLYISNNPESPNSNLEQMSINYINVIRISLLLVQAISLAGIASATNLLSKGKYFKKWMEERTKAEKKRIELFETVCGMRGVILPVEVRRNEIPLLLLQLEYFRRYQLEVQINYYRGRSKQHEVAANRWLTRGAYIVFLGTLAATITSSLTFYNDWINAFAIMGVITPILLGVQSKLSLINQDERNAIRYNITAEHLGKKQQKLVEIRQAASKNDLEYVHRFIKDVNEVISVEHKQWLEKTNKTGEENSTVEK